MEKAFLPTFGSGLLTLPWQWLTNLLLPGTCLVCEASVNQHGGCCPKCWSEMRFISPPICPVMGTPFTVDIGEGMLCAEAISDPPPFDRLRACVLYNDSARRLVSGLKFNDRIENARWMANWLHTSGSELLQDNPLIIPVPLHRSRMIARRYNQSAELARHLARRSGLKGNYRPTILKRRRATRQQVGLTHSQRQQNVSGAFAVNPLKKQELKGANVLLIDDVYTTGATVRAATKCLLRAGASKVDVLVFAKVETRDL